MDTKDGLTAWEAIRLLFPKPEPRIKVDLELWSGGTTWVDAEYDEWPRSAVSSFQDLLRKDSWYAKGRRVPVDPTAHCKRVRSGLWGFLSLDPDNDTASGGGLEYVGLRFYKKKKVGKSLSPEPVNRADLKRFMKIRIDDLKGSGKRSNAYQDEDAARKHFKGRSIPRNWIKEIRKQSVPSEWSARGRRKVTDN